MGRGWPRIGRLVSAAEVAMYHRIVVWPVPASEESVVAVWDAWTSNHSTVACGYTR